jgi:predicted nicotinamide N-methyase
MQFSSTMNKFGYRAETYHVMGLELYVPDPDQVRTAYESGELREFPYWSKIWASARALASWLNEEPELIREKDILEIGAGIGLPSFIASSYASTVTVSDQLPDAVEWMDLNISKLGLKNTSTLQLDWKARPLPVAEVILLSDIGYDEENFDDIREMIIHYITAGSLLLMSVPCRIISARFIRLLEEFVQARSIVNSMETEILLLALGANDSP